MSNIVVQKWQPLRNDEYQMVRNYVIINDSKLIAGYRGGTLEVELTDNVRLCLLETIVVPGPDWASAPVDANYWAANPDGFAMFYEEEPVRYETVTYCGWGAKVIYGLEQGMKWDGGTIELPMGVDWRTTLQQRTGE